MFKMPHKKLILSKTKTDKKNLEDVVKEGKETLLGRKADTVLT